MVSKTTREEMTWYRCESCGLMFDAEADARQHEQDCESEDTSGIR